VILLFWLSLFENVVPAFFPISSPIGKNKKKIQKKKYMGYTQLRLYLKWQILDHGLLGMQE